jgi:hypothetical protein
LCGRWRAQARAAAGAGAGSGGGGSVRERERCERGREDAGEGMRESWAFKWAFFPFHELQYCINILTQKWAFKSLAQEYSLISFFFFSFKYLYMYYSSPRKTPWNA